MPIERVRLPLSAPQFEVLVIALHKGTDSLGHSGRCSRRDSLSLTPAA